MDLANWALRTSQKFTIGVKTGVVRTPENGYWVSSATSHTLQGLEGEEGSYVVAYSC